LLMPSRAQAGGRGRVNVVVVPPYDHLRIINFMTDYARVWAQERRGGENVHNGEQRDLQR